MKRKHNPLVLAKPHISLQSMQNKFGVKLLTRNKMSIFSNSDLDLWWIPKCIPKRALPVFLLYKKCGVNMINGTVVIWGNKFSKFSNCDLDFYRTNRNTFRSKLHTIMFLLYNKFGININNGTVVICQQINFYI